MAGKKRASGPNKSGFIRGILQKNSAASAKDVQQAWKDAGHRVELNPTLYYQVRRSMGLAKGRKKRRGRRSAAPAGVSRSAAPQDASSGYLEIERQLDKLLALAGEIGDRGLTQDLLTARRRASAKLV